MCQIFCSSACATFNAKNLLKVGYCHSEFPSVVVCNVTVLCAFRKKRFHFDVAQRLEDRLFLIP